MPNYADIYGPAYKMVAHILVHYEQKAKQKAYIKSLDDFDFNNMPPYPIKIVDKDYLKRACEHLKVEQNRLLRVVYVCQTTIVKRMFALCFWMFMIIVKGGKIDKSLKEKREQMEEKLKEKLF